MLDISFYGQTLAALAAGLPLTLRLTLSSVLIGGILAFGLALMRVSGNALLDWPARVYIFVFRGTPLLVQIYIIYYGLSQFEVVRRGVFWPLLRDASFCAIAALALNTAAYSAEIIRGGILSVSVGQIEAARACGMPRILLFRRIIWPQALRQMLPAYSNEILLMVKATALASTITLMEVTGLAAKLISETYKPIEVFICAGALYLTINITAVQLFYWAERAIMRDRRAPGALRQAILKNGVVDAR